MNSVDWLPSRGLSIGTVLAVAGVAVTARLVSQLERTLIDLAHPVTSLGRTDPDLSSSPGWLSSHQLLLVSGSSDRGSDRWNGGGPSWRGVVP